MLVQGRSKKSLTVDIVLDSANGFSPAYLCFRNAGISAELMFANDPDDIVWTCAKPFTITFVQVVNGQKQPLGSSPFSNWSSGQMGSVSANGENVLSGNVDRVKKGGAGRAWSYKIDVPGTPKPLDPMIIIET